MKRLLLMVIVLVNLLYGDLANGVRDGLVPTVSLPPGYTKHKGVICINVKPVKCKDCASIAMVKAISIKDKLKITAGSLVLKVKTSLTKIKGLMFKNKNNDVYNKTLTILKDKVSLTFSASLNK